MAVARPRYTQKKRRRRGSKFKRGFYEPVNESKYVQPQDTHMNSGEFPEYRSSWELAFYKYLDESENVISWSAEAFHIKYISPKDGQPHRYFPDVMFVDSNNQKHVIEIKPAKQCKQKVNLAKWEAAERYCEQINAKFSVITEVELAKWGLIKA